MASCGTHTDIASTDAIKVTRCTCGTLYVTLVALGVTVRMQPEMLKSIANGLRFAADRLDLQGGTATCTGSPTGSTMN